MKILLVCLNFAPEPLGVGKYTGELAHWLDARGHDIRVITAPPWYPQWKVTGGHSAWRCRRERMGRIEVLRCPVRVPSRCSFTGRLKLLASFALSSFVPVLTVALRWRPDLVVAFEPTVLATPAVLLAARLTGARTCLHVQDREVEAAFRFQLLPGARLAAALERAYGWLLRRFDLVTTISRSMLGRITAAGLDLDRVSLCPNWVDTQAIRPLPGRSWLRRSLGVEDHEILVLYAGNFGEKQGLGTLVEVARRLAGQPGIRIVFCGAGAARAGLVHRIAALPNALLLPVQPRRLLNELLNAADVHLLPMRAGGGDVCFPSKLGGMLASGRPVVALTDRGELAQILEGRGIVVGPDDAVGAADGVLRLARDGELRAQLGAAGRAFAEHQLERERVLPRHEARLRSLLAGAASAGAGKWAALARGSAVLQHPSRTP